MSVDDKPGIAREPVVVTPPRNPADELYINAQKKLASQGQRQPTENFANPYGNDIVINPDLKAVLAQQDAELSTPPELPKPPQKSWLDKLLGK